jgi:hypothetical protein
VGIKAFCPDVTVRVTSDDLATETTANADAIAYSGLSAERPTKNKALPVLDAAKGVAVAPSADTIRAFTYPLARRLYVTVASGSHSPNAAEDRLLQNLLDPSFVDPILAAHEFITCPVTGCP